MNFLQLCQRTREKCAITGTGPASVIGQSGEMLRLVNWVNEAWLELQTLEDNWAFMWARGTFDTVMSGATYARDYDLGTGVSRVDDESVTCYDSDGEAGEWRLSPVVYQDYRRSIDLGAEEAQAPSRFTILPDRVMRLIPRPDAVYTLQFDYYAMPTSMAANSDVPSLAEESLQWAIIYGAMRRYALHENAAEALAEADAEYRRVLTAIRRRHLPRPRTGAPLA
jgi:hypothetical protein